MSEHGLEDKVSSLLSSPDVMEQILSMAKSLSGGAAAKPQPAPPENAASAPVGSPVPPAESSASAASAVFGGLDPQLLSMFSGLFQEYGERDDQRVALLLALKPFLKEERSAKIDRAIQLTKLARVAKAALRGLKGGKDDV